MFPNFKNYSGQLLPAIIQDAETRQVLMLGYMNEEALNKTKTTGKVTFFSRSKNRLWTKGEESGNFLQVSDIKVDCDGDTLLIRVIPEGPTCHKGTDTCWAESNSAHLGFLSKLEDIIDQRRESSPEESYVAALFEDGIYRMAQKVGEEGLETALEATKKPNANLTEEAADLVFHLLVLLRAKGHSMAEVIHILEKRHNQK